MRAHRCLAPALLLASLFLSCPLQATVANYSDWWWNEQQSGHGLNIGQQNDVLFVSWFTYDEAGAGMWLTMTATLVGNVATGNWVRTTGPRLGTTFDPASVVRTTVGTGTLTFASLHAATLAWTVNAQSGTLTLTRTSWASTLPASGVHLGRMNLQRTDCPQLENLNLPITSTYTVTVDGSAITIVDDFKATGTKICTMNGTFSPSGSYFKVEGTYSCVALTQTGTWTGTLLVRPPFLLRDEVLTIDGSTCLYRQTTITSPSAIVGP